MLFISSHSVHKNQGFTLIEVMIAMAILAMLGLASASVFQQMTRAERTSVAHHERLSELQRAFVVLERDVRQMVARQIHTFEANNNFQSGVLFVHHDKGLLDSEDDGILFVRGGWFNPNAIFPRAELQKVGYRLREGVLERLATPYVDSLNNPQVAPLLKGVESFEVYFQAAQQSALNRSWQLRDQLPLLVVIKIKHEQFGTLERSLLTSGSLPSQLENTRQGELDG